MTMLDVDTRPKVPMQAERSGRTPADLVAAARIDPLAWNDLLQRYGPMVRSIARAHRLSEADAADVTQTVWLRLVEHLGRLQQPGRVGAWLATTTRNEARRVVRLQARTTPVGDLESFVVAEQDADRPSSVEVDERDRSLRAAVASLPTQQRDLIMLLMSEVQPSYVEVSAKLGIPIGSIGPTRQRSLRSLRVKCLAAAL